MAFVAPNISAIASAQGAASVIFATISRIPAIDSASTDGKLLEEKLQGLITFENVSFVYPSRPSITVLENFWASFPRGKVTAVCVFLSTSLEVACRLLLDRCVACWCLWFG